MGKTLQKNILSKSNKRLRRTHWPEKKRKLKTTSFPQQKLILFKNKKTPAPYALASKKDVWEKRSNKHVYYKKTTNAWGVRTGLKNNSNIKTDLYPTNAFYHKNKAPAAYALANKIQSYLKKKFNSKMHFVPKQSAHGVRTGPNKKEAPAALPQGLIKQF